MPRGRRRGRVEHRARGRAGQGREPARGLELVGRAGEVRQEEGPRDDEQLGDERLGEAVLDGVPAARRGDDARPAQHREVLGELGRLAPGDVEQHGDGRGVVGVGGEDLEHLDARGVREAPEELGLDAVEGAVSSVPGRRRRVGVGGARVLRATG